MAQAATCQSAVRGWLARLQLRFERRAGHTVLSGRRHEGPLLVQKPFYPEGGGRCHVYLVHPPSGIVGGDRIETEIHVGEGAHGLATTPGAAKWYRSQGSEATAAQNFNVAPGGVLEWMPQEAIVHDGAKARSETVVRLEGDALFFGWEVACLGLPASGQPFASGRFVQGFRLERDGEPLFMDRCQLEPGDILRQAWGLGGHTVSGILMATLPAGADAKAFAAFEKMPATCAGVVDGVLVARYLGRDAWEAKRDFTEIWRVWRQAALASPACPPRIWNT